jgi:hypothetical protein
VDNFNYTDSRSYTAPGGSTHTHITQSQVAGGYYYTFNGWTPGTTAGMQQVTLPASGTADYVANFTRSGIVVTVNNTAQCAVGVAPASLYMIPPPPIVMPIGIPFLVTAVAGSPSGFTISVGGAAPVSYASFQSQVGPFSAPITITPQCSTTVTHTVTTAPAGLQVTIDGGTPVAAPQTVSWAAGSAHTLGAPTPQLNAAGDIQYTLQNWTPAGPAIASAPASATTYTANFSTAYKVTVTLNGCTNTNTAGIPAGGGSVFVPAGSSFVTTVSASAGQVILSATVNGAAQTVSGSTLQNNVNAVNAPLTMTVTCGPAAAVTLTVLTSPAGLDARIGQSGAYAAAPITQQVPPGQTQFISVTTPQIRSGTGYRFTGWSTGGSTPTTTVQPSSNFTATANFQTACHTLTVNASPANGGTVTRNPASGVEGFPANCYAPGTQVTLTANPASGFALASWTGASGTAATTTVTVSGPMTVTANFAAAPAISFSFQSRTDGNLSLLVRILPKPITVLP